MKLRYITCSDPREHNSIQDMVDLAKLPHAEIAVQCHPSKMSAGMPRNVWFNDVLRVARNERNMNLAIHINMEWADSICAKGVIPDTVLNWMQITKCFHRPVIKRVQLNMPWATAININPDAVAQIIHDFPKHEFIFQYNKNTKDAIEKLHQTGAKFSLLFDASGGKGIAPSAWQKPVYETHPMGYSGGISPENVVDNLEKINCLVPEKQKIWIDAEGKLKTDDKFDIARARQYVLNAENWLAQQKQK